MRRRLTTIAVIIPVLGLIVLILRAQFTIASAPTWRIPIEGYDPRDLLAGQYLQYRFRFNWGSEHECGSGDEASPWLDHGCCLCLQRADPLGIDPEVTRVSCDSPPARCDGVLEAAAVRPPLRYFIPEARATDLENALRTRAAALELVINPERAPAIVELYLDGRPWREVLQ